MGDALPPDPYLALGVAKDATAAAIKTQYRKLVLKFHPDKVQDETQKQAAADQFHRIQTAYEIVSDEARRARYDAQFKLAELRKDAMDRDRGGRRTSSDDDRSPRYAPQPEPARDYSARERGPRVSPQYATEERRPSYAHQDYFDPEPRTTSRKDAYEERPSKRTAVKEQRTKSSKASSVGGRKKDERSSRKEKSKKSDREVRSERQRKFTPPTVEEVSDSDSDAYERRRRQMRDEDDIRKVQQQYYEHERRQREQAEAGYFGDERTRKLFSQRNEAREHIERSVRTPRGEEPPDRRPSPVRMASSREHVEQRRPSPPRMHSSKDGVEYVRRGDRPAAVRRGSSRPQSSGNPRAREAEMVEEPARDARKPPPLNHTKSSPPVVGPEVRQSGEKQRSYSVQMDNGRNEEPPKASMRRAETMPYPRTKEAAPEKRSRLRHGNSAYPTPETSPERPSRKFEYGRSQAHADDEYASPVDYETSNRYETEERKPQRATSHKRERYGDEPVAKDSRERQRSTSTKHAAQPPPLSRNTSSTQYVYRDGQVQEPYPTRPNVSRQESSRLYGEIPTTSQSRSPAQARARYSPPAEYSRNFSSEPVNMQTGYKTKERPGMGSRRETSHRRTVV